MFVCHCHRRMYIAGDIALTWAFSCMQTGRTALDYAATSECRRFLQMYSTAHQIGDEADTVSGVI